MIIDVLLAIVSLDVVVSVKWIIINHRSEFMEDEGHP